MNLWVVFLFILSILVLESQICQALTLVRHGKHSRLSSSSRGVDRASSGYANTTHPWPWLWPAFTDPREYSDNERACQGYIIGLDERFAIMHTETADRIKTMRSMAPFMFIPTPFFYAKRHGPNKEKTFPGEKVHMPAIIHTFCEYALFGWTESDPELYAPPIKPFVHPKLEGNLSEPGKDCFGYGWSDSPINDKYIHENEMRYVKFRVKTERKKDGTFKVTGIDGMLCNEYGDKGTPILCGPEEKLTYLASSLGDLECKYEMEAYHIAPMVAEMKQLHFIGKDAVRDVVVTT